MRLLLERIAHQNQRYETIGDWEFKEQRGEVVLRVRISILRSFESELAVALHEVIEAVLCRRAGISGAEVDKFDMAHPELDDPGNDPRAPYHIQHMIATSAERLFIRLFGGQWQDHDDIVSDPPPNARGAGVVLDTALPDLPIIFSMLGDLLRGQERSYSGVRRGVESFLKQGAFGTAQGDEGRQGDEGGQASEGRQES